MINDYYLLLGESNKHTFNNLTLFEGDRYRAAFEFTPMSIFSRCIFMLEYLAWHLSADNL